MPNRFSPIFPTSRQNLDTQIRSIIWVNTSLNTSTWRPVDVPGTNDITAIQLQGTYGQLIIFNIYNNCEHSEFLDMLNAYLQEHHEEIYSNPNDLVIWAGDFNQHHLNWDSDEDQCLFTTEAMEKSEKLIDLLADWDMHMPLSKGIPILQHMVTKKYS
jgi:hypothetical protein